MGQPHKDQGVTQSRPLILVGQSSHTSQTLEASPVNRLQAVGMHERSRKTNGQPRDSGHPLHHPLQAQARTLSTSLPHPAHPQAPNLLFSPLPNLPRPSALS